MSVVSSRGNSVLESTGYDRILFAGLTGESATPMYLKLFQDPSGKDCFNGRKMVHLVQLNE